MKNKLVATLGILLPLGCCIADVDVGQLTNGLERLSFAPQLTEQLANAAVGDAALIESLFSEWTALEPTSVMATNRLFVPVGSTNAVPDSTPLRIRMAQFATEGPEQRLARVPGEVTAGYGSGPRMAWRLQYTEAEVAAGRNRNHLARLLALREISLGYDEMDDEVREDYYATAQSFWIDVNPVRYGAGRASERREEDGIPSVESLLSWFATNVSSTAEIQEDANWRLSLLSGIQGNEP